VRRTFAIALSAALAGALALTSISVGAADRARVATLDGADPGARLAARASDKYKGRFKGVPGSKIKIKAKTEGGVPTKIKKMSYVNLPASCPVSMATSIDGGWTLSGVTVGDNRKFNAIGDDGHPTNPSSLRFKGKFTADYDKVKGRFQTNSYFGPDNPPEETCVSENRKYVAKR
jgi:hypothetical protein